MSAATVETSTTTEGTDAVETPAKPTYEKGSWQASLHRAGVLLDKSDTDRKKAGILLWQGGRAAIADWVDGPADTDSGAEGLYQEVLGILGESRKGSASKIKTVALAVRNHGLSVVAYPNLAQAYAEAKRLMVTVQQQQAEDDAAEEAIEALAAEAPHSASTPENAAKIVLAKGLDEAARLLLDALGASNDAAHRALLRAISSEIAGRVKPKTQPKAQSGPKEGAEEATATKAAPRAQVKSGTAKPKPGTKATPTKATPAKAVKPGTKATPAKPQAEAAEKKAAPAHTTGDTEVEAPAKAKPVVPQAKVKATPVAVRAARA